MKRKTKQQREDEQKSALRRRVADIAAGAMGGDFDVEGEYATAQFLSRFVPALKALFGKKVDWAFNLHSLHEFDTVDSTTEHLWDCGIRA